MRNYLALKITVSLYKNYNCIKKLLSRYLLVTAIFYIFIKSAKPNYELMRSFSHTTARVI